MDLSSIKISNQSSFGEESGQLIKNHSRYCIEVDSARLLSMTHDAFLMREPAFVLLDPLSFKVDIRVPADGSSSSTETESSSSVKIKPAKVDINIDRFCFHLQKDKVCQRSIFSMLFLLRILTVFFRF